MELNYKSIGQGKPVIFLHGLFGMLDNWQSFGKRIADAGYWAFLLDQRAHGKSNSGNEFNYKVLSEDLNNFLDANWIHECILIGHSMGGKTAMQFANDFPDYIEKLIVVDIAPKRYAGGHNEIFNALLSINLKETTSRQEVFDHLKNKLSDQPESVIQFLLKNLKRKKEGGYEWKMNVKLLFENYNHILDNVQINHKIEVETLFIKGGKSNYIKKEDRDILSSKFLNFKLLTIEDAGHWVHADQPDELFKSIVSFIER